MKAPRSVSIGDEVRLYEIDESDPKGKTECYFEGSVKSVSLGRVIVEFNGRVISYLQGSFMECFPYFGKRVLVPIMHGFDITAKTA